MSADTLLYDYLQDGKVAEGEALLTLGDGATERCQEAELYPAPVKATGGDYWDSTGQIFYTGGYGVGVAADLSSVCLGTELDVLGYLKGGELPAGISQAAVSVLVKIRERKEKGESADGKAGANFRPTSQYRAGKVRMQRAKPAGNVKLGLRNFRKTPAKA